MKPKPQPGDAFELFQSHFDQLLNPVGYQYSAEAENLAQASFLATQQTHGVLHIFGGSA